MGAGTNLKKIISEVPYYANKRFLTFLNERYSTALFLGDTQTARSMDLFMSCIRNELEDTNCSPAIRLLRKMLTYNSNSRQYDLKGSEQIFPDCIPYEFFLTTR